MGNRPPARRRKRRPPPRNRRRKRQKQTSVASGVIYVFAVVIAIALGGLVYKFYLDAQENSGKASKAFSDLPPGATIITKTGETKVVPGEKARKKKIAEAKKARKERNEAAVAFEEALVPLEGEVPLQARPEGPPPDLLPLPVQPWTLRDTVFDRPQKSLLYPTADTTIYLKPESRKSINTGLDVTLTAKGGHSLILTRYDIRESEGWTVRKAIFKAKVKEGKAKTLRFSEITAYWEEGISKGQVTPDRGATYAWADYGNYRWRTDGSPAPYVIDGHGDGASCVAEPDDPDNQPGDWVTYELDPRIVQSLIAGKAYGIAIVDEKGQLDAPTVFGSREEDDASYYIDIEGGAVDQVSPGMVDNVLVYDHPGLRRTDKVGVVLTWDATGDDGESGQAYRYDVRYSPVRTDFKSAARVLQHETPSPQPSGTTDKMIIEGLDPRTTYTFFIRAIDEAGNKGEVAKTKFRTGSQLHFGDIRPPESNTDKPLPIVDKTMGLLVLQLLDSMDPKTAKVTRSSEGAETRHEGKSFTWDSLTRTIYIRSARNATASFQLAAVRGAESAPAIKLSVDELKQSNGDSLGSDAQVSRIWYSARTKGVNKQWYGDAMLPHEEYIPIPTKDNRVKGQRAQAFLIETRIPKRATPGTYRATITVRSTEHSEDEIHLVLDVAEATLRDRPSFVVELSGSPIAALLYRKDITSPESSFPIEKTYHQLARNHGCTYAPRPYLSNGVCPAPFRPSLSGSGIHLAVASWKAWDKRFGPLLDGNAFRGASINPGEPTSHIILPLFENWPTAWADSYECSEENITLSSGLRVYGGPSGKVHKCMKDDYWRAIKNVTHAFGTHFKGNDWSRTKAHVVLDNDPTADYKGPPPPWFLASPTTRDDYLALEAYAQYVTDEAESWGDKQLVFRATVPDVSVLRDYGKSVFDLLCIKDENPSAWNVLRERSMKTGEALWIERDLVPLRDSNVPFYATMLSSFMNGATGCTIQECHGQAGDWMKAHDRSILYCGLPKQLNGPLPSLRLKILHAAQQDIELLMALREKKQWSRDQLTDFVQHTIPGTDIARATASQDWLLLRSAALDLLGK